MHTKSYANRVTNLSTSLQWDHGRWIWLLSILAVGAVLLGLGDNTQHLLRYDRAAVAAGQWWRLLSGHAVHADLHHFVLNALGLVLVWALFAREFNALGWLLVTLAGAAAISAGLWYLDAQVQWYVGASGVLHALMAAGCVKRFADAQWDRWILAGFLAGKLMLEQYFQARGVIATTRDLTIVVDAHLYGAAGGTAMAAAMLANIAILRQFGIRT
jgi:rhomboid family GlyGly-CTERM serine protease